MQKYLMCVVGILLLWQAIVNVQAQEILTVPASKTLPLLDGQIDSEEWKDAQYYQLPVSRGSIEVWLKHVELIDSNRAGFCQVYPNNPDYQVPCGRQLLLGFRAAGLRNVDIYLGEGDDGLYGSGSDDRQLVGMQEDAKCFRFISDRSCRGIGGEPDSSDSFSDFFASAALAVANDDAEGESCPYCREYFGKVEGCPEPACTPWNPNDCWRCHPNNTARCVWSSNPLLTVAALPGSRRVPIDGYYLRNGRSAWWHTGVRELVNFMAFFAQEHGEAEFMIPFIGLEGISSSDLSDLNINPGDVVGIHLLTSLGEYPSDSSRWLAKTWGQLRLE